MTNTTDASTQASRAASLQPAVRADLLRGGVLIGGNWHRDTSAGAMDHVNPATGQVQSSFPIAGLVEVDQAVAAAKAASARWRTSSPGERQTILNRIAALLRERHDLFAATTTLENGTPVSVASHHAVAAAAWFEYYAGWTDKVSGQTMPLAGVFNYTRLEPYPVVAIILTWNGPTGSIGMKVAAALAAGCTVVLKPPELAPFSSSLFGQLALDAGLPPGVLNVVVGGPEAGDRLVRHPDVEKISFTGGPGTAARIQAACAESLTPLILELGGKSANIILDDANLDSACTSAAFGIAALSGQVCIAPTRLVVHESVYDEVIDRVTATLRSLPIGDPNDPQTVMGPLISSAARSRVAQVIDRAVREGSGQLLLGGSAAPDAPSGGFFVSPTVFAGVDNATSLARDEVFGPVLAVISVKSAAEAVAVTNDSPYGLAAYLHTRDLDRAIQIAGDLEVGNVGINSANPIGGPATPFGGFKGSGYGKEGGIQGLLEYTRIKNVNIAVGAGL